jgi:hypothetical protein
LHEEVINKLYNQAIYGNSKGVLDLLAKCGHKVTLKTLEVIFYSAIFFNTLLCKEKR